MNDDTIRIAGAGPAGLSAALTVARAGRRAVVYEQRRDVGGRFHGDFQGLENWTTQGDVLEELAGIGIRPDFEHVPVREVVLFDPRGREHVCRSASPLFYLLRRGSESGTLDMSLKQQALANGVEIRFREQWQPDQEGGIVSSGPHSAGVIAVGYIFETSMPDGMFTAVSDELAPKGYAYLLVHGGRGTLATCMFAGFDQHNDCLERCVAFFQERVGLVMQNPRRYGGIGGFAYPASASEGNLLYAGEAAGFQDALFGFGIRYAIVSGHLAAYALMEGRSEDYDRIWKQRFGGMLRAAIVNRYFYGHAGRLGYTELARRASGASDARDWLRHYYNSSLLKRLCYPFARRGIVFTRVALIRGSLGTDRGGGA